MSFPRYPAYKDSGVEVVPLIPESWEPMRLRFLLRDGCDGIKIGPFGSQLTSDMLDDAGDYKVYGQENVIANDFVRGSRYVDRAKFEELTAYEIKPGDLLVTMMGTSGRCDVVPTKMVPGIMDSHLLRIRVTPSIRPAFARLLIDEAAYVGTQIDLAGKGSIMHGLNSTIVKNLLLLVPPDGEQAQILTFLDHETAKIDALVAEQERLIELLKEKRQAVISQAVTKGLDPSVPMKDSGVEWLGEVPAHWGVGKCGFYLRILNGFAFPSTGFTDDETAHRLLRGVNVGVSRLKWDDTVYWQRSSDDGLDEYEMAEGDLVMGMDRPLISEGMRVAKVSAADLPSLLLQRVASLKVGPNLHVDYLHYLLASEMFVAHFSPETTGVSVPHISPDQINNFVVPIPPISEQTKISEHVQLATAMFGGLIDEAENATLLLQERRTALISAAVTGQIDVRGWVPAEAVA